VIPLSRRVGDPERFPAVCGFGRRDGYTAKGLIESAEVPASSSGIAPHQRPSARMTAGIVRSRISMSSHGDQRSM
jgi:hypothetical protein